MQGYFNLSSTAAITTNTMYERQSFSANTSSNLDSFENNHEIDNLQNSEHSQINIEISLNEGRLKKANEAFGQTAPNSRDDNGVQSAASFRNMEG